VIADFIDSMVLDVTACLVGLMLLGMIYWGKVLGLLPQGGTEFTFFEALSSFWLQVFLVGVRGVLSLFYFGWGTYVFGTTLGKKPFGIYVVQASNHLPVTLRQSLIRFFAYIVSYLPLSAGFLMVGFHPEKRGLHDLIAGTVSVIRSKERRRSLNSR
jgi:uncharacterized RDD family membrane protein YckC